MDSSETMYGSDEQGLVWGYVFKPLEAARPLTSLEAESWLLSEEGAGEGGFIWLHYSLASAGWERWLRQHTAIPEAYYESMRERIGFTRLELNEDSLLAVLHDVLFDFTFDASAVSTVSICVQPNVFITGRLRPLRSVDQLRAAVKEGEKFRSTADLLAHLMRDQADVLMNVVHMCSARVDEIEDTLLAARSTTTRAELGALRRMLVRLQRLLAPEPAALFRLLNRPPTWIGTEDTKDLEQSAEEFSAAVADSASLIERLKLLHEEIGDLATDRSNRTLSILTAVTVSVLPFSVVSGLFGMNVGGIPFAEHPVGFAIIVCTLVVCTLVLTYFTMSRLRR